MAANDMRHGWWHTLPGMLTGIAGMITAITGLMVVLQRAGTFRATPETTLERAADAPAAARQSTPTSRPRPPATVSPQRSPPSSPKPRPRPAVAPAPKPSATKESETAASPDAGTAAQAPDAATAVGPATNEQTGRRGADGAIDSLAGTWTGWAEDSAGHTVPASAEVKDDGSFNIHSELTGEQSGTMRASGERIVWKTSAQAAGTITLGKSADGTELLTWEGLAPAGATEPGPDASRGSISLKLERAK